MLEALPNLSGEAETTQDALSWLGMDPASTSSYPADSSRLQAIGGNRAALALLVIQNVVSALLVGLGWSLGTALLASLAVNAVVGWLFFGKELRALFADVRWRTPPQLGLTLGAFLLAFLASRAFLLAFVTFFPGAIAGAPSS
ncbi:hypothetical protein ACFP81_03840 [Deinococcus lacus]|uniref:Uncharacterized protein n=1 Tax=Deinococcus lacus TaxID=392561 RepID=A0ABW1YB95_9DEIO